TAALEEVEKNKFQLKGRYKSEGGNGIPIGAFNVPRGSVRVTAGGRVLVEGIDYTVNYQLGTVQILDPALQASNTPINVSVENNSIFGQQSKRFFGVNIEHKFNENFVIGGTYISLKERPITQKANYNNEPISNKIYGLNVNYSTEVPFLTRLVNKLPNIDTDVPSNLSVRGEIAALRPGSPKGTDFQGVATSYVDDFEGSQSSIDLKSALSWHLSSRPDVLPVNILGDNTQGIQNGFGRGLLNWYHIDPIFYSNQRPGGISDDDMSGLYTSRVFINELFPQQDIAQGQTAVLNTLDLAYYPDERGPYNFQVTQVDPSTNTLTQPQNSWAGITRQLTSTDFEQANVEYIEFWLQDPFQENPTNPGGKIVFNLGNISEDVIKDGRKLYENGLPQDGDISGLTPTTFGTVVPQNQSLIYAFDTTGGERTNQDVGYDGYDDIEEQGLEALYGSLPDPANDNYTYFLNTDGDLFERYKRYNGTQGNSPDTFTDTNRGNTTQPDVEDINRDNTMNTIDSYFEYELDISPTDLNIDNPYIVDIKDSEARLLANGGTVVPVWYQFRVPVEEFTSNVGGIADLRSIRFARMYVKDFTEPTIFRFGSLDLVRSEWRRYGQTLDDDGGDPSLDPTIFTVGVISTLENDGSYQSPPGVDPEELYNNNTVIRQNEQSLVLNVCDLESKDARAVYKNISVDMRQYKRLQMFMHAEEGEIPGLGDKDLVGFIRMGNDLTQNYYQIEVPLTVSTGTSRSALWPEENQIDIQLELLQQIKAAAISDGLGALSPTFYDVVGNDLTLVPPGGEFDGYEGIEQRVGILGNPNFGDIRTLMVGVKNASSGNRCGEIWFNELRLADMDNNGGWAAVLSLDSNIADFADVSATGARSTAGFGGIEEGPQQRSIEDVVQYGVVTNVNVGQLLPEEWGIQIPFNYGQGEEIITPKYDQLYKDIELDTRLDAAENNEERNTIQEQSEDYTKRKSINFIGVRKNRTTDKTPRFYDVENLTLNYSYNKVDHRDFEIESSVDKQVAAGVNYAFNFNPLIIEPFKENDSIFTGKYWKLFKDFNVNPLPTSFTINTNYNRQFNKQKFREVELGGANIGLEELYRRNYIFDFQYTLNYNLTKSLSFDFTANNNNIVRNYFIDDQLNGRQDPDLDVWDSFFDVGDPNMQYQRLGVNYDIPINKIPTFSFVNATYTYSGEFQWQKGSDLFGNIELDGQIYDLGNSISNANSHNINSSLDMNKLYKYLGIEPKRNTGRGKQGRESKGTPPGEDDKAKKPKTKKPSKLGNFGLGLLTMVKRIQGNYNEINGTYLPGYLQSPGFIGTLKPTLGYTFGSQRDIRGLAARNGWLTRFPEFNQQYTEIKSKQLDYSVNIEPFNDFKIDLVGNRIISENFAENYNINNVGGELEYESLTPNSFGNFTISTLLIKTAFSKSDEFESQPFDDFSNNRLTVANRLAVERGIDINNPANIDAEGFPLGYGKTSQAVLLPSFLSGYAGQDAGKVKLTAFRDMPIPNWDIKYTGLMKLAWFKQRFKRFSLSHGYRS
ncbi:cell surface protein SprA, partial [Oceanihabitans sp.]|nr:cell surface protein SprA [Oceanihabitans sp.]